MSWLGGKRGPAGKQHVLPMAARWTQAMNAGQARLDPFTSAELDCVTLDPEFLPAEIRGPALQAVSPLLRWVAARKEAASGGGPAARPVSLPSDLALAAAASALDRRGYLLPGAQERPGTPVPTELGGWSADPAGGTEPRPVTIAGDLGIITRARSQPYWVAEVSEPPSPGQSDPTAAQWRMVSRMYTTYRPSTGVVEFPVGRDGSLPPFSLLWEDRVTWALWSWAGIDLDEMRYESNPGYVEQVPDLPTAEVAGEFERVRCLRIAHPTGQRVLVRSLVAAAAGRTHWILDGDYAERAVRVSVNQLGERIETLTQPAGAEDY